MATPEIQTWAESEQFSVFSSWWLPDGVCYTEVLDLICSSSCTIIKLGLLQLLHSPVGHWPVQVLLPPELSCANPCICSSSGTGKGLRIQLLGWGEKSPQWPTQWWLVWCVCGRTAFPSLCLDMFFVHLYHVSMKTTENPETSHWSRINCHRSEHWLVSVWSLAHVQMTKGCLHGEDTYFFIQGLNVVVMLFIQSG